ncbi:MAG: VCBS repeat-containing protein, partial [Lentisphaerota bacterium]
FCASTDMSAYRLGGVADFNNDGIKDLLWQRLLNNTNMSLNYLVWLMSRSGSMASEVNVATNLEVQALWPVISAGDVTGDGYADITLGYNNGYMLYTYYCSNGLYVGNSGAISNLIPFGVSFKGANLP